MDAILAFFVSVFNMIVDTIWKLVVLIVLFILAIVAISTTSLYLLAHYAG